VSVASIIDFFIAVSVGTKNAALSPQEEKIERTLEILVSDAKII
jgi:hypothetical protein